MKLTRLAEVALIVVISASLLHSQTVIQHHSATIASGTSVSVALTGVTAGDWLVVDTSTSFLETITMPSDTAADSYALAVNKLPSAGSRAATYYALARSSGNVTVTCSISGSADNIHCHVYEVSGLTNSSPLDVIGSSQTSGTANSLSIATSANTTAADYCHAFFAANSVANSFTVGSGWGNTETTSNGSNRSGDASFSEDRDVASGVTPTATATAQNADQFTNLISCYRAASGTADFSISASPSSQTVTQGNQTTYTTTVTALNGFTGTVSLSVSGLPSGATGQFNPTSVTGSGNSTLTVSTASNTPTGTSTLTINGISGSLNHSTTVQLTVNSASGCNPQTAFYVATNGSDSNPGTQSQPFLTLGKAQSAMQGSSTKLTYLRTGTYNQSTMLTFTSADNNETWKTYVCDAARSAMIVDMISGTPMFKITSASGITFTNLTIDGNNGTNINDNGAIVVSASSNIHVTNDTFQNNPKRADISFYNSDYIYYQGNSAQTNEMQPVSGTIDDGQNHVGFYVTDNTLSNFSRMGVEMAPNSNAGTFGAAHVDRNVIGPYSNGSQWGGSNMGVSLVMNLSGTQTSCSTIYGNTFNGTAGYVQWGIEVSSPGPAGVSVEQNTMTNVDAPITIGKAVGTEIENNSLTNWGNDPPFNDCAYNKDGGYNATEWIGTNTLNGSQVTGDFGCLGHGAYGQKPAVCTPSTPYVH